MFLEIFFSGLTVIDVNVFFIPKFTRWVGLESLDWERGDANFLFYVSNLLTVVAKGLRCISCSIRPSFITGSKLLFIYSFSNCFSCHFNMEDGCTVEDHSCDNFLDVLAIFWCYFPACIQHLISIISPQQNGMLSCLCCAGSYTPTNICFLC